MEKIYTIPVNEAFDNCRHDPSLGCPFCALHDMLESNELDIILGAAMMEPDIRIKTNEQGFCPEHFNLMLSRKNRLGLGLILESHLDKLRSELEDGKLSTLIKGSGSSATARLEKLEHDCYICGRIDYSLSKMIENSVFLWENDPEFRKKLDEQPYICLPHFRAFAECGRKNLSKKEFSSFYAQLSEVVFRYFDELRSDVSWFCKKFDYRYEKEPWKNSKDSLERAVKFLSTSGHSEPKAQG